MKDQNKNDDRSILPTNESNEIPQVISLQEVLSEIRKGFNRLENQHATIVYNPNNVLQAPCTKRSPNKKVIRLTSEVLEEVQKTLTNLHKLLQELKGDQ